VFTGTIRRNLDLFYKAGDVEMWRCLEEVGLKGYVEVLKEGLDTRAGQLVFSAPIRRRNRPDPVPFGPPDLSGIRIDFF